MCVTGLEGHIAYGTSDWLKSNITTEKIATGNDQDDRSPLTSGNESDESSDIDSPGPPSINNSQNMMATDSPGLDHAQNFHQQQGSSVNSAHYEAFKSSQLAQLGGGNVLYPTSALSNIPQEVLLSLVQSGHLQLHSEEDGSGHQFITIPLSSMAAGNNSSSSSSISGGSAGGGGGPSAHVSTANSNKLHIKDLSAKGGSSSSSMSAANGRESPPKEGIRIKEEIID